MTYNPEIHHRRSIRLKGYDYSQAGAYYVTICNDNRDVLFGEKFQTGDVVLNEFGKIVENEWLKTPENTTKYFALSNYVIMPNHFHGIYFIVIDRRGVLQYAPTQYATKSMDPTPTTVPMQYYVHRPKPLAQSIRGF